MFKKFDINKKLNIPNVIVIKTLLKTMAAKTAMIAEYNLKFSVTKMMLFSKTDNPLNIIGVKITKGIYCSEGLILGYIFFGIIPDNGMNLIKNVKTPHKTIVNHVILFYPIFLL
jgi:hypothetical protein